MLALNHPAYGVLESITSWSLARTQTLTEILYVTLMPLKFPNWATVPLIKTWLNHRIYVRTAWPLDQVTAPLEAERELLLFHGQVRAIVKLMVIRVSGVHAATRA